MICRRTCTGWRSAAIWANFPLVRIPRRRWQRMSRCLPTFLRRCPCRRVPRGLFWWATCRLMAMRLSVLCARPRSVRSVCFPLTRRMPDAIRLRIAIWDFPCFMPWACVPMSWSSGWRHGSSRRRGYTTADCPPSSHAVPCMGKAGCEGRGTIRRDGACCVRPMPEQGIWPSDNLRPTARRRG